MRSLSSKSSLFLALGLLGLTTACGEPKNDVDGGLDVTQPPVQDVTQSPVEDVTQSPVDVHQPDVHQPDVHQPVVTKNKSCRNVFDDKTVANHDKDGQFFIQSADGKSEVKVYCEMVPLQKTHKDGAEEPGWTLILATKAYDATKDTGKDIQKEFGIFAIKEVETPAPGTPGYLKHDLVKHLADAAGQVKIASLDPTKSEKEYVVSLATLHDNTIYKSPLGNLIAGQRLDLTKQAYADKDTDDMKTWFVGDKLGAMGVLYRTHGVGDTLQIQYPNIFWAEGNNGGLHLEGNRSAWGDPVWKNTSAEDVKNSIALGVYVR